MDIRNRREKFGEYSSTKEDTVTKESSLHILAHCYCVETGESPQCVEYHSKKNLALTAATPSARSSTSGFALHLANNDLEWRGERPRSEGLSVGSY
ncbi:unnamed protein product [Colias eurytheme]|nr:unnamed protein product [Colias eurytheme]